jgi:hypothetical protein
VAPLPDTITVTKTYAAALLEATGDQLAVTKTYAAALLEATGDQLAVTKTYAAALLDSTNSVSATKVYGAALLDTAEDTPIKVTKAAGVAILDSLGDRVAMTKAAGVAILDSLGDRVAVAKAGGVAILDALGDRVAVTKAGGVAILDSTNSVSVTKAGGVVVLDVTEEPATPLAVSKLHGVAVLDSAGDRIGIDKLHGVAVLDSAGDRIGLGKLHGVAVLDSVGDRLGIDKLHGVAVLDSTNSVSVGKLHGVAVLDATSNSVSVGKLHGVAVLDSTADPVEEPEMVVLFCGSEPDDFTPYDPTGGSTDPAHWRPGTVRYAVPGNRSFALPQKMMWPNPLYLSVSFTLTAASGYAGRPLVTFYDGAQPVMALRLLDDTLPATWYWSHPMPDGQWVGFGYPTAGHEFKQNVRYRIRLTVNYDRSGNGFTQYNIAIDGMFATVVTLGATVESGSHYVTATGIDRVMLGSAAMPVYFSEVIAATQNTYPMYLIATPPTGTAGTVETTGGITSTAWTGSWNDVKETVADPATGLTTTTAAAGAAGVLSNLPLTSAVDPAKSNDDWMWHIHAVKALTMASGGTAAQSVAVGLRSRGQQYVAPAQSLPVDGSQTPVSKMWETRPDTLAEWTEADINTLQLILKAE